MFVYILKSLGDSDGYYTGITKNLEDRLAHHNGGQVYHTAKYRPWKIKNYFWFEDEPKALRFEKYLKTASGRAFCKKHF